MKILITGGNSATAFKLLKVLSQHQVVLADYGDVPILASQSYQMVSLGTKNEDTIAHTLLNNCLDYSVEAILPLHHFELDAIAKAQTLFTEFNISVLLPLVLELPNYLLAEKGEELLILHDGEILSDALNNDRNLNVERLSGAFYVTPLGLSLITI